MYMSGKHYVKVKLNMSIFKDVYAEDELPFNKFQKFGPQNLSDAELLAIMLRTGTKGSNPIELGRQVLKLSKNNSGLLGLNHLSVKDLTKIPGIGEVKAIQLLCIAEIAKRISYTQASKNLSFEMPQTVAAYYMEQMRHRDTEQLIMVMLDTRNRFISDAVLTTGTINSTLISPREIFVKAMKEGAANIIILHNHPSGDSTPSRQDMLITNKIKEVSDLVEIPLLDHIIIGDNQYTSFKQKGLL